MIFTKSIKVRQQKRFANLIQNAVENMPQEPQNLPNQIDGKVPAFYKSFSGVLFGDTPLARYAIYHSKGKFAVLRICQGHYRQVFAGTQIQSLRFVRVNIAKALRKNTALNEVFFWSHLALVDYFLANEKARA